MRWVKTGARQSEDLQGLVSERALPTEGGPNHSAASRNSLAGQASCNLVELPEWRQAH